LLYGIEKESDDIVSRKIKDFDFINFSESYPHEGFVIRSSFITSLLLKCIDRNLSKTMTSLLSKFTYDFNWTNGNGRMFIGKLLLSLLVYANKCSVDKKIQLSYYNINCVHSLVEKVSNMPGNENLCVRLIAYTSIFGDIWSLNKMKRFVKFETSYQVSGPGGGYRILGVGPLSTDLISRICYVIDKSNDSLNSKRVLVGTEIYRLSKKSFGDNLWFERLIGKSSKSVLKDISTTTKKGLKFIKDFSLFK
jgi:hypothetical protein